MTDVVVHPDLNWDEVISVVAAIENESTHSLAQALTAYGLEHAGDQVNDVNVHNMTTISGIGVTAIVHRRTRA